MGVVVVVVTVVVVVGVDVGVGVETGCVDGVEVGFETVLRTGFETTTACVAGAFATAATGVCADVLAAWCAAGATLWTAAGTLTSALVATGWSVGFAARCAGNAAARMTVDAEPAATRPACELSDPAVKSQSGAMIEPASATGTTRSLTVCAKPDLNLLPPPPDKTIET